MLKVNWNKSSNLPLDAGARDIADPALSLKWVSQIRYLGVKVTVHVANYMPLNLTPLLTFFKKKVQAWQRLPLSLLGRVNLLKMKVLLVILYFSHMDSQVLFQKIGWHYQLVFVVS